MNNIRDFYRIPNFNQKKSRLLFSRYLLTGTFEPVESYQCGNPTFNTLTPALKGIYKRDKDNLFDGLVPEYFSNIPSQGDLIQYIIDQLHTKIMSLA